MTKRILAIVTALVMAVSMLSVVAVAAEDDLGLTISASNNKVSYGWTYSGTTTVDYYYYSVYNTTTGSYLVSRTKATSALSGQGKAITASGTYVLTVEAYSSSSSSPVATDSKSVVATYTDSSSNADGTVTVSGNTSSTVSFTTNSKYASYVVNYTTTSGTTNSVVVTSSPYTISSVAYSSLRSVTVIGYTLAGGTGTATTIGTWTNRTTNTSSGITADGMTVTNSGYSSTYSAYIYSFSWTSTGAASYKITYTSNGAGSGSQTLGSTVTSYSAYLVAGYTYYVTLYGYTGTSATGTATKIGTATIVSGSNSSGTGTTNGVYYTNNGTNSYGLYSYTATWSAYSSSTVGYYVYVNENYYGKTTSTYYQITGLSLGTSYSVVVYAYNSSGTILGTVGSCTFTAGGTSASGTATSTITATYLKTDSNGLTYRISWNSVSNATYYVVTVGSKTGYVSSSYSYYDVTGLTSGTTYAVSVVAYNVSSGTLTSLGTVGTTLFKASGTSTTTGTTTSGENCTVVSGTSSMTVTWNSVSGATAYVLTYFADNEKGVSTTTTTTSATIPVANTSTCTLYVVAYNSYGTSLGVCALANIAATTSSSNSSGSSSNTSSSSDSDASVYPTSFKATSGNSGKITLSWTAADDATSYTVYWKRSSNSTWKKAGTVKKTAVTITGLNDGISYDFYVVANTGYSSGTATITCSTKTSTVTATDPVASTATLSSLTSVTSSATGSITVSWTAVSGATSYKVYVAEGSSSTYKCKATVTSGTSTTITGLTSGTTYKVRVVAVPYQTDLSTDLKACSYMSVTVK